MPIPVLTLNGLLPAGVHRCTLEEVQIRFGVFAGSDRRVVLFETLQALVRDLVRSGIFSALVVDGSFATAKPLPGDVDLILLLRSNHDWTADLSPGDYNLISRRALHRRTGFDVLIAADGDATCQGYVEFFSRVREDASIRKGMLRIEL